MGRKTKSENRSDTVGVLRGPALQALADSLPLPVILTDPAGFPLLANGAFRNHMGVAPEAGWLSLVDIRDRPDAEALWLAAGVERAPQEAEMRVRTPAGSTALCCRIAPIEQEGRLLGWFITFAETSRPFEEELAKARAATALAEAQQREAEAHGTASDAARQKAEARLALAEGRLRESEARRATAEARVAQAFRQLDGSEERGRRAAETARAWIEAAPGMLWTAGPDGVPDLYSRTMREETGAGAMGDWLGQIHPEDRVRVLGLWGHAVGTGQPFEAEHRLRCGQGDYRPVLARARPVWDALGNPLGWIGICTDRREAHANENALADARKRLDRARSDLAQARAGAPAPRPAARLVADISPAKAATGPVTGPALTSPALGGGAAAQAGIMPERDAEPHDGELDRLARRLRSEDLREGLARWRAARGGAGLPRFEVWEIGGKGTVGQVAAEIDASGAPVRLRVVRSAPDLPLLRALLPGLEGDATGWNRASTLRRPVHDYARMELGPLGTQSFERLILPFSTEGDRVDRAVLLLVAERDTPTALAS